MECRTRGSKVPAGLNRVGSLLQARRPKGPRQRRFPWPGTDACEQPCLPSWLRRRSFLPGVHRRLWPSQWRFPISLECSSFRYLQLLLRSYLFGSCWFFLTFRQSSPVALLKSCYVPRPRASRKLQGSTDLRARHGVGDRVRFLERTKTRVGTVGRLRTGKLHKWRTCKANGALPEDGTEDVCAFQ